MSIAVLAAELTGDPLARGYAGMTHEQAAASLNAPDRPVPVDVGALRKYLRETMHGTPARPLLLRAQDIAADPLWVDIGQRDAARLALDAVEESGNTVDMAKAVVGVMLDRLIAAGAMAAAHKTAIIALGSNRRSRAQELGLGRVKAGHVIEARGA